MSLSRFNTHCTERHTHPLPQFPTPILSSTFFSSCSQYSDPHHCHASTHTVLKGTHTLHLSFPHPSSVPGSSAPVHITVTHVIVTHPRPLFPTPFLSSTFFSSCSHYSDPHHQHITCTERQTHTLCQHCQQDLLLTEICQFLKQTYCIFSKQNFVDNVPIKLPKTINVNISLPSPAEWRPTLSTYLPILLSAP